MGRAMTLGDLVAVLGSLSLSERADALARLQVVLDEEWQAIQDEACAPGYVPFESDRFAAYAYVREVVRALGNQTNIRPSPNGTLADALRRAGVRRHIERLEHAILAAVPTV